LGTGVSEIDNTVRELNNKFEEDYKKLRHSYEKELRAVSDKLTEKQKGLPSSAGGVSQQKQQKGQHPASGMEMERERGQALENPNNSYFYDFKSTRQIKDGKETGETIEKKEKVLDGKKVLETKITKYNPDGTKDVQRIIEDESGKKETKLRLDNKDQPLQLQ